MNLATVQKRIDIALRNISKEELKREDSERKQKSVEKKLVELKTRQEKLKANVALYISFVDRGAHEGNESRY